MKGLVCVLIFLMTGIPLYGNSSDTTVTSFEIYLKRRSPDNPLGFNTCSIDRMHIYQLVMKKIGGKIKTENFHSIHNPLVLMKFHDVTKKQKHNIGDIASGVKASMDGHRYKYFIKIFGHLDIDSPLNQFQKATFTLKVYIFDAEGNLIKKSKSKSRDRHLEEFTQTTQGEEHYPLNEQEFFELVTDAADTIEIGI